MLDLPQRGIDFIAGQAPGVVQFGHHPPHEAFGQRQGPLRIAQVIGQQRQRQLPRAVALIGPLEPHPAEPPHIEARIERRAVHRHHRAVEAERPPWSPSSGHPNITTLRTVSPRFSAAKPSLIASSGMRAEIISSSFSAPSR